jgi:hypothetical protein
MLWQRCAVKTVLNLDAAIKPPFDIFWNRRGNPSAAVVLVIPDIDILFSQVSVNKWQEELVSIPRVAEKQQVIERHV